MTEYDRLLVAEFFDRVTPLESEVLVLMIQVLKKGRFDVFRSLEGLIGELLEPDTVKCSPDFDLIGLLRTYNFEEDEILAWGRCVCRACEMRSDSALQTIQAALRLRLQN